MRDSIVILEGKGRGARNARFGGRAAAAEPSAAHAGGAGISAAAGTSGGAPAGSACACKRRPSVRKHIHSGRKTPAPTRGHAHRNLPVPACQWRVARRGVPHSQRKDAPLRHVHRHATLHAAAGHQHVCGFFSLFFWKTWAAFALSLVKPTATCSDLDGGVRHRHAELPPRTRPSVVCRSDCHWPATRR